MATKTTTKSPARKSTTTARKPAAANQSRVESAKTAPQKAAPSKAKETKPRTPENPARAVTAETNKAVENKASEKPAAPRVEKKAESVSLIDEIKAKPKPPDGEAKIKKTILPPISRLVGQSTDGALPPPLPEPAPPPPAHAEAPPSTEAAPTAEEPVEEPKNLIVIKPPIIVHELATQLGIKK